MDDPGAGGTRCRDPGCYSAGRAGKCRGAGKRPGPGRAERTPDSLVRHRRPSRSSQYGRRHLLQLVAVKRRQAEGRSLAEIQAELAGATDEALAAVARVPDIDPAPPATPAAPSRFWVRQPRPPSQPTPATERPGRPESGAAFSPAGLVHGVRLAPGVMLLLEGADREPGPDDVTQIVNAARPLVRELADRGLCACGPGNPPDVQGHPPGVEQPAEESRI
jgi:hypothetical protein